MPGMAFHVTADWRPFERRSGSSRGGKQHNRYHELARVVSLAIRRLATGAVAGFH